MRARNVLDLQDREERKSNGSNWPVVHFGEDNGDREKTQVQKAVD